MKETRPGVGRTTLAAQNRYETICLWQVGGVKTPLPSHHLVSILNHIGKISHQMARLLAEQEYSKVHQQGLQNDAAKTDKHLLRLLKKAEQLTAPDKAKKDKNT